MRTGLCLSDDLLGYIFFVKNLFLSFPYKQFILCVLVILWLMQDNNEFADFKKIIFVLGSFIVYD